MKARSVFAALALASACTPAAPPAPESRWVERRGIYDPQDRMGVVTLDLVMDATADVGALRLREIPILSGPFEDDRGRVVTVRITGAAAARLAAIGFHAEAHRTRTLEQVEPGTDVVAQAGGSPCTWPISSPLFAPYDNVAGAYKGGLAQEMQDMAKPNVVVQKIATTFEGRSVIAVRVGAPGKGEADRRPTVVVLGVHHAREWVTSEVSMRLLREYAAAAGTSSYLGQLLEKAAVVFVPVVNADGYQYSRTVERWQRKNRRPTCAGAPEDDGVDVNRNYAFAWGVPADSGSNSACDDVYIGPSAASEPEIAGVQSLLSGGKFADTRVVAGISYHSYADVLIYSDGINLVGGATGPACGPADNCTTPDFQVFRRLWGDTEDPILFDVVDQKTWYPASTDNNVLYSVSGDFKLYMNYGPPKALGVVPELTGKDVGFDIECAADPEAQVAAIVEQQRKVLLGLVENAAKLASTTAASAYATNQFGKIALGVFAREASGSLTHDSARPRLMVSRWLPSDDGSPVTVVAAGYSTQPLHPGRKGAQYHAMYLDAAELNPSAPWCLPCEYVVRSNAPTSGYTAGCTGCIDLTDEDRLPHVGWRLVSGLRGGALDYWWEPEPGGAASQDAVLTVPGFTANKPDLTYCHLSYTTHWTPLSGDGTVILERQTPSGWEEVIRWPFADPISEWRDWVSTRLRSDVAETSGELPLARTFRFRIPAGQTAPTGFKLFEPITICRWGKKF